MKNIKGCRVYLRVGRVRKIGTIVKEIESAAGGSHQAVIKLDKPLRGLPTIQRALGDLLIVPKQTPAAWRKVLRYNEGVKGLKDVAVCYDPWCGRQATTLFHTKTLQLLKMHLKEISFARVCLWEERPIPSEGKLEVLDNETVYSVGPVEIQIEDIEHY